MVDDGGMAEATDARAEPTALTAEELAAIAAQMVRLIEARLESHSDRLEQMIAFAGDGSPRVTVGGFDDATDMAILDDHLALVGRAVVDVQKAVAELCAAPWAVDSKAIMAHVDQRFEETNARLTTNAELAQQAAQREFAVSVQQAEARLEEAGERLAQKVEDQLASRVQRFEALSQAMMALAGEPIDALTGELQQLARQRHDAAQRDVRIQQLLERLDGATSVQPL